MGSIPRGVCAPFRVGAVKRLWAPVSLEMQMPGLAIDPTLRPTPNNGGGQQLLTVQEVADLLRCSACTVRRLRYRGHLRAVEVRGSAMLRYQREDVYALLDKRAAGR